MRDSVCKGGIEETSATEVERVYRTNVFGLLNVTRTVLPSMRQRRSGHIINLSSIGGYRSTPGWGIYSSTKFAVEGITEALHHELYQIRLISYKKGNLCKSLKSSFSLPPAPSKAAVFMISL